MYGGMKKPSNESQSKTNEKSYKKYVRILRSLAEYDTPLNKMKVTVCKEDINEVKKQFYLTSNTNPTKSSKLYFSEDSFIEETKNPIDDDELVDYPDSSDLEGE